MFSRTDLKEILFGHYIKVTKYKIPDKVKKDKFFWGGCRRPLEALSPCGQGNPESKNVVR